MFGLLPVNGLTWIYQEGIAIMFEHHAQPLLPRTVFFRRFVLHGALASLIVLVSLSAGMVGYHLLERLSWIDAFVNASMILGGMGPVAELHTTAGKLFAGLYALYSGLVLLVAAGVLFAPVVHRFLHRFHLENKLLLLVMALSVCASAQAGSTYQWLDRDGVTHFTDNAERIPAGYLSAVQERPSAPPAAATPAPSPPAPAASPSPPSQVVGQGEGLQLTAGARLGQELKALKEALAVKKKELSRLRHKWSVAKGRVPTSDELLEFEKKRAGGQVKVEDNPYINKSPLSSPGRARQAYYQKLQEVRLDEGQLRQLEKELAAAGQGTGSAGK